MTLPYEHYIAMTNTRNFLLSLTDSQKTPKVPKSLRTEARSLLKHYPNEYEANDMVKAHTENLSQDTADKVWNNPIEYSPRHGGWIFWDETWSDPNGPFPTRSDAQNAFNAYLNIL